MNQSHKTAFRILFFLYLAAVLVLCFVQFDSTPEVPLQLWGIPTDKVVHFFMFFPFPVLAFLAFDQYTETARQSLGFVGITLLIGLVLAFGTEWGQAHLTETREGDPLDFLADSVGLLLSSLLVLWMDIRKQ